MSKRVMVVDDSKVIHSQMHKILDGTDFEIIKCVRSGESAIEEYEGLKPDVITMDILMPGVDGLKAAKQIIDKWPEARILMVSSLAYDETIDEAVKIGAKGFIFKPFKEEAVIKALNQALRD